MFLIAHLDTIVYNKTLSRAKRVHFDVGSIHFICYDLYDNQHVKFSREMTSYVFKPFVLPFA